MKARTQTTVSASSQRRPAETGPNESSLSMKHHPPSDHRRASCCISVVLLVCLVLQWGLLPSSAETLKEPARADDRLSPAAFADPPIQNRPGCFWAWLNGSITAEQVTRDLEAMKRYGILPAEFDAEKKDVDTYDLDWKYWQQFWYQTGGPVE